MFCGDIRFLAFAAFSEMATDTSSRSITVTITGVFGVTDSIEISSITVTFGINTGLEMIFKENAKRFMWNTRFITSE